jgi:hypothetical protein
MATIRDRYVLEIDTQGSLRGINDTTAAIGRIDGSLRGIKNAAGVAVGALAGIGAVNLAAGAVETYTAYENLTTQIATYTGGLENARVELERLETLAVELPQDLDDVASAFTILTRTGIDTSTESLRAFSDIAAANGKSLEQLAEAVADGMTGEFERFKEFGIKVSKEGDNLVARIGDQQVAVAGSSQQLVEQLVALGQEGGRFFGAGAANADTLSQSFSNLDGAISIAERAFVEGLKPGLQDVVASITEFITNNKDLLEQLGAGIGAAIGSALEFLQQLIDFFKSTGDETSTVGQIVNDILLPAFELLKTTLGSLYEAFKPVLEAALPILKTLLEALGEVVTNVIVPAIEVFAQLMTRLLEFMAPIYETALPIMTDLFTGLADVVTTVVGGAFNGLITIIETVQGWITSTIDMISAAITKIREMSNAVSDTVSGMADSVTGAAQDAYNGVTGWFGSMYDEVVGNSIVPDMVQNVLSEFDFMNQGMGASVREGALNVARGFDGIAANISTGFNSFVSQALNGVSSQVNQITNGIFGQIQSLAGSVNSAFGGVFSNIGNLFGGGGGGNFLGGIVDNLFGGFDDLFAGFFANGGVIPRGQFGVVGERGPELISGPAQITPMDQIGGQQYVTYNINATDARSFRDLLARDPGFIHAIAQQGARRVPGRF